MRKDPAILLTRVAVFSAAVLILIYPQEAFQAALSGLDTWLKIVFPALLPFFIVSEIMTGTGIVDFIAALLHPVMLPLFHCPGYSSFIWVMSITSGYPVGVKLTASLRQHKKITRAEGQRSLAFCSTSGPLFMMGAVGVGMLGNTLAGRIITVSHYLASILTGLVFRFYYPYPEKKYEWKKQPCEVRKQERCTVGELLSDAVRNSVNTLLFIGGFIILFSVLINLLIKTGLIGWLSDIISFPATHAGIRKDLLKGIIAGFFEITTGCRLVSQADATFAQKIISISFLIGWSGFSIHGQAAGILSKTDLSTSLYLLSKTCHGIFSALISWGLVNLSCPADLPASAPVITVEYQSWIQRLWTSSELVLSASVVLLCAAVASAAVHSFIAGSTKQKSARKH